MLDQKINAFVLKQFRRIIRVRRMVLARVRGQRFYCNALNGTSDYNISVNCDMTVSCSCADHEAIDLIGDLSKQTLGEIFDSPRAKELRHAMAQGILPFIQCATCPEVRTVPKEQAGSYETGYTTPHHGILIENSINCNYNCRSCTRSLIVKKRSRRSLTLEDVRMLSRMLRDYKIRSLYYFKLGEVFLSPTILDEVRIIRADNPDIVIKVESNGAVIDSDSKREAALQMNRVRISIDGPTTDILRKYQRGGTFERSFKNICDLVAFRNSRGKKLPLIEWKYVVFNWNDSEWMILEAIKRAREAGVDGISFWPTVSPFYGISLRYKYRLYSKAIRDYASDSFFVKLR